VMVATGRAASLGVLFRDAEAIETLRLVDTLIVDKTGTLTAGKPAFREALSVNGSVVVAEDRQPGDAAAYPVEPHRMRDRAGDDSASGALQVLALAASLDQGSEHPLAETIVAAARERGLALQPVEDFDSVTGLGVRGSVGGHALALGNTALMDESGIDTGPLRERAEALRAEGASVMYLAADARLAGLLAVADPIKPTTPEALAALRADGIEVIMATGDGATTAQAVARTLGIDRVHGEVRPRDKAELVAQLKAAGRRVAMAGDGINDAPALAAADVGIAMGTGTDVAMSSAQVTLLRGDLNGIARARRVSRAAVRNMRQNLAFAFLYNALGVPLAAGLLYPFTGWLLSPMIAALAMSLSSVSVVGNALRLRAQRI